MHRETYPAKWWRGWKGEEKEPGEDNSAASWTSPLLPVLWIQQCQGPFLSLQKQAAHVLLYPPKRLKCCRPVGTELWWDSKHHHAAFSSLSQLPSPKKPITHMLPLVLHNSPFSRMSLCSDQAVCVYRHTHPPVTGTLLASSATIIQSCPCSIRQERDKSKDRDCVRREEGNYKDKRSHL